MIFKRTAFFKYTGRKGIGLGQFKPKPLIASFQHGVLESRLTWLPPEASWSLDASILWRHDEHLYFHVL
jgi:hypothetical protein